MVQTRMPFGVLALCSLLAGLTAAPSHAQNTTQVVPVEPAQPAGALPTFLSPQAPAAAPAPAAAVVEPDPATACISEAFAPSSQTAMRLKLVIGAGGSVAALPYLIEPAAPDTAVRLDYLGLVTAIEGCAPFSAWANGGEYVLTKSAEGTLEAKPLAINEPAEQSAAALPTFTAPTIVAPSVTAPAATAPAIAAPTVTAPSTQAPSTQAPTATAPAAAVPNFLQPPGYGITSPDTETELAMDRAAIRDVQARLLVLGHDPNGVDGVLGKGARAALANWQSVNGVAPSGYLNELQLQTLKTQSQAGLDAWLQDPANAAKYTPPAVKRTTTKKKSASRKKKRVRACKRNAFGMLYDCRYVWR